MAGAALLLTTAVLLVARSLTYTGWYQHRIYGRMPLEQLAEEARRQPGNSIVLYCYGRALDEKGRFTEALVPLEHAAGLDPDDPRVRGEWSAAQLAGGYITGAFGQLTQFVHTHPRSAVGHMMLGRFYVAQNSYVRAVEELEQAVRIDSHLGEAWSLLAGARAKTGGVVPARDAARRAVALRPNSAVDHMLLASLLLATNDRNGARQEYAEAVALSPKDPDYLREYAHILLKDGDTRAIVMAEQVARRAVALNPHTPNAYYDLGRVLAQEGKTAEALGPLRIAASMLPPGTPQSTLAANAPEQFLAPAPALELARAYRTLGSVQEAKSWEGRYVRRQRLLEEERRLGDAVRNHPEQTQFRRQMALFLARRGDVEGAAKNFAGVLNSAPDAPKVLVEAANALAAAGYGGLAAPLARRAPVFSKNSPAAQEAWGNALLAMGQPEEASVKYARAAGWWPEKMPLYRRRIANYYRQRRQRPSEAEKLYEQAFALERIALGLPFNIDKVKALLERAVALEPRNTDFRRYLLRVLVRRHELAEAEQTARTLLALSPEDGLGHGMLAVLLLEKADSERCLPEVEAHLKAAEEEGTVLPTLHYAQGVLALRRQQAQQAVRLLRQSADEDPADLTYYQLAQAERLAGNTADAAKTMAKFSAHVARNRQAIERMKRIADRPDDRQRYADAIRYFAQHGMKAQAAVVETEMRRRFGVDRVPMLTENP
jgi:tetratricopeptide (TPR) repeat protein